ncbi:Uncharacterized protein SCG7109_AG_00310 [Chlamydiales bacterium SCGC AG-110-M15]|nr:Uncharacterized protein SCG7109_AG_00310 [Chlamydiales bacterium SCGC AG-110-M15]
MKILIVKTSSLGDLIHVFPVLSYLRQRFPEAQIDWVVERPFASLIEAHPYVNRVISIDTRVWKRALFSRRTWREIRDARRELRTEEYDCVYDLQGNVKSGLVTFLARSACKVGFGPASLPEWPNRFFTNHQYEISLGQNIREDYLSIVKQHLSDKGEGGEKDVDEAVLLLRLSDDERRSIQPYLLDKAILVCPGSAWRNKRMTEEALIALLRGILKNAGGSGETHLLFAWGSDEERACVGRLHEEFLGECESTVMERLSLPALQHVMAHVETVLAMDSLALHLCGTTQTPSLSVFGPSAMNKYKPLGSEHRAYQGKCPYGQQFEKRCPILRTCQTGACIRDLDVGEVLECLGREGREGSEKCPKKDSSI